VAAQEDIADGLEATGKLPGYLALSACLKFADVLDDLVAISKGAGCGLGFDPCLLGFLRDLAGLSRAQRLPWTTSA
jgi:hypothetical protein